MSKDEMVIDEYLLKVSKWQHFKLWLWHRKKLYADNSLGKEGG